MDVTGEVSTLEKTLINLSTNGMNVFRIKTEKHGEEIVMQLSYPKDSVHTKLTPDVKELQGETIRYTINTGEDEEKGYSRWKIQVLTGINKGTTYEWLRHYKLPPKPAEYKKRK